MEEQLLAGLTEQQRRVVQQVDGPVLVLAGPGSGKTTVVTRRVAYLLAQGIPPWQILALTFTNKAAGEMRHRIEALLPPAPGENASEGRPVPGPIPGAGSFPGPGMRRGLTISTFHAFCARLLRRFADAAGISPTFTIYDTADQREAIKRVLEAASMSGRTWTPGAVAAAISKAKNALLDAAAFAAQARDFSDRAIARLYHAYEKLLRESQSLDFDDLLLRTALLLRRAREVRESLQQRYQYILIDEYQDTNHAQFVIADALAAAHRNLCVVGDADQSIYGWRGADIGNILEFEQHYPGAAVIPLGQNFRSTGHIVAAAAGLIEHNRRRKAKMLHTDLGEGEKPRIIVCEDAVHESATVVRELRALHEAHGLPWREMAVLYRMNALSRVLEDAFRREQVPYVIARGTAFFERKEVKDALSYLRLIVNPADEVSLRRIINTPPRGLGEVTLSRLERCAADGSLRLLEAMARAGTIEGLSRRAAAAAGTLASMIELWQSAGGGDQPAALAMRLAESHAGSPLGALVERIIQQSGLEAMYSASRSEEDAERLENLNELITAAAQFEPPDDDAGDAARGPGGSILGRLAAFLESITLVSDADAIDPSQGAVTLMTLHAAKGLEFDAIALIGLEMGLLPHARALERDGDLEEERRLCFVGMTRARRHLILTRAAARGHRGAFELTVPSLFLREIPPDSVELADLTDAPADPADASDTAELRGERWVDVDAFDDVPRGGRRAASGSPAATAAAAAVRAFPVGCLVRHPSFGIGRVEACEPRSRGSASVRVRFQAAGMKTLLLEYARLERVG